MINRPRLVAWVLDHPGPIVSIVAALTLFLGYWFTRVSTDHTAGQFASADTKEARDFQRAGRLFGQSQTVLYIMFEGIDPLEPGFLDELAGFTQRVQQYEGVKQVLSLANMPYLARQGNGLVPRRLLEPDVSPDELRRRVLAQPFLQGLLLSRDGKTTVMMVTFDETFNDTPARVKVVRRIADEAEKLPGNAAFTGFPYLRTQYAERVTRESPLFTLLAMLVSMAFLFLTFRSWRAVVLPTVIVVLGIVWAFGLVSLFGHKLNIVTAVLPALIVVIGIATAIHLMTKYYDLYAAFGDRRKAVTEALQIVGMATFLTAFTTAIGFAVLVFSGSRLLIVFGAFAAVAIMLVYVLCVTLIPLMFLHSRPPSRQVTSLVTHDWFADRFGRLGSFIREHATAIVLVSAVFLVSGAIGATRIPTDIYVFSDFYEDDPLRQDLALYEQYYGGVLPLEVVVESKRPGLFRTPVNLRRLERLQAGLDTLPSVGRTFSVVQLVKLANQAYLGGHPATYRLPSTYELPFLQSALKGLISGNSRSGMLSNLPKIVDSTFTTTRIYMGISDIGTTRMNQLADTVRARAAAVFPAEQFDVIVTGTAVMSNRSGESLVRNLIWSLAAALVMISAIMALLFRTARLTFISLVPNVLPLVLVGGAMGFGGITLKPSTALIFSLAFGIAVDNTIHFLSKYRLLRNRGANKNDAIHATLKETGKAMFFASLILVAGFLVFTLSSFGGTVNMGALTSLTLGTALLSNLVLLPALLYRFGPEEHRTSGPEATETAEQVPVGR